jgi:hypothetical protein
MNDFDPETLLDVAKQKSEEDVDYCFNRRETSSNRWLIAFGAWMVASGKLLQARHKKASKASQHFLLHNKTRKIGI